MDTALILMSRLLSMMLMVIVGYLIVKLHVIESKEGRTLSSLVIYVLQPCLIFRSFQIQITPERITGFLAVMLAGFVIYSVWILLTSLLRRPLGLNSIEICSLIYGNVGNLMLPLINMMMGSEYVFYASALQVPFNLFVWTHGFSSISGRRQFDFRWIISNPNIIAMILGLLFCVFQLHMPEVVDTAMSGLAGMVGPSSMLVIGIVIAGKNLRQVLTMKRGYLISLGRLVLMPAVVLILFGLTGFLTRFPGLFKVMTVFFISTCAPPAATVSQLAVLYNQHPFECSVYNVLSMFACVLTMPLMLLLFQMLFGTVA